MELPPLDILYEDNHCIAVAKPAGALSTHFQGTEETLDRVAKSYLKQKYQKPGNVFLGIVHRLDRPVSGVLLFARTSKAAARLADRYDGIIFLADPATVKAGLPAQAKALAVVYCAQPGVSPINALSKELGEIRESGGIVRGVILWNSDRPMLATPRELAGGRSRKKETPTLAMSH